LCLNALVKNNIISGEPEEQERIKAILSNALSQHLAILWSPEDVAGVVPEAECSPEFISKVFDAVHRQHDAEIGVNWMAIGYAANTVLQQEATDAQ
jgi:hypothetical protein